MDERFLLIFERIATALDRIADSLSSMDYATGEATETEDGE